MLQRIAVDRREVERVPGPKPEAKRDRRGGHGPHPRAPFGRRHHGRREAEDEERRRPVGQDDVLEQMGREERGERDVLERREQADRNQRQTGAEAGPAPERRGVAAPAERAHHKRVVDGGHDDRHGPFRVGLKLPGIDRGHELRPPARAAPS